MQKVISTLAPSLRLLCGRSFKQRCNNFWWVEFDSCVRLLEIESAGRKRSFPARGIARIFQKGGGGGGQGAKTRLLSPDFHVIFATLKHSLQRGVTGTPGPSPPGYAPVSRIQYSCRSCARLTFPTTTGKFYKYLWCSLLYFSWKVIIRYPIVNLQENLLLFVSSDKVSEFSTLKSSLLSMSKLNIFAFADKYRTNKEQKVQNCRDMDVHSKKSTSKLFGDQVRKAIKLYISDKNDCWLKAFSLFSPSINKCAKTIHLSTLTTIRLQKMVFTTLVVVVVVVFKSSRIRTINRRPRLLHLQC